MQRIRRRLMHWIWDGKPEWLTLQLWDWNVGRALCWIAGHEPICAHCGHPDHDYCAFCNGSMPGQAHRTKGAPDAS